MIERSDPGCPPPRHGCLFAKALLADSARCECAERASSGEQALVHCTRPVAHHNCETLAALLHERARFALKLPGAGRPLLHMQALRLQCGGLAALQQYLASPSAHAGAGDVHALTRAAMARHGSLAELPWDQLVAALVQWKPRARRGAAP
jgi:hypothetical protein